MTTRFEQAGVEIVEVPPHLVRLIKRRNAAILRFWMLRGDFNLDLLIASIYLQGTYDGFTACEHQRPGEPDREGPL